MPRPGQVGFTLIETLLACAILIAVIVGVTVSFRNEVTTRARVRQETADSQVEEAVRRYLFRGLRAYFTDPVTGATATCPKPPNPPLPASCCTQAAHPILAVLNGQQTPSGIRYDNLTAAAAGALMQPDTGEPSLSKFNATMTRCQGASTVGMSNTFLRTNAGVYFCLLFKTNPAVYQAGQNDMLTTMAPVVGEFFFTNIQIHQAGAVPNGEVMCPQLNGLLLPPGGPPPPPSVPTLGLLYYTLYWSPRINPSGGNTTQIYDSTTGLIAAGNG